MQGETTRRLNSIFFLVSTNSEEAFRQSVALGGRGSNGSKQLSKPKNPSSLPLEKRRVPRGAPAGGSELVPQARPPQEGLGMLPHVLEVSDEVEVREELVQPEVYLGK